MIKSVISVVVSALAIGSVGVGQVVASPTVSHHDSARIATPLNGQPEEDQIPEDLIGRPSPFVEASSESDALVKLARIEADAKAGRSTLSEPTFGPCVLYPSQMHLRKSGGWGVIGPKPYTKCTAGGITVHYETKLYYKWYTVWRSVGTWDDDGAVAWVNKQKSFMYTQKDINRECKGATDTTWNSSTLGRIVVGGKTLYARAYGKTVEEKCTA